MSITIKLSIRPADQPQMLCELDFLLSTPKEIAIAGQRENEDTQAALAAVHSRYIPNKVLALASDGEDVSDLIPLLEGKTQVDGEATIYVFENYTCPSPDDGCRGIGGAASIGWRVSHCREGEGVVITQS